MHGYTGKVYGGEAFYQWMTGEESADEEQHTRKF